jgi:uncharacterized membrane protein (Fun14 family)
LGFVEDLFGFVASDSINGVPTIVLIAIPLVIGLILGFLVHKFLKFALIATAIVIIGAYLGFYTLNLSAMADLAEQYGPTIVQFSTILIGMLPLGIGLVVGFIVGFLISK